MEEGYRGKDEEGSPEVVKNIKENIEEKLFTNKTIGEEKGIYPERIQ